MTIVKEDITPGETPEETPDGDTPDGGNKGTNIDREMTRGRGDCEGCNI